MELDVLVGAYANHRYNVSLPRNILEFLGSLSYGRARTRIFRVDL